jgi:hypothetical protein
MTGTRRAWLVVTAVFLLIFWLSAEVVQAPAILRQAHIDPGFTGWYFQGVLFGTAIQVCLGHLVVVLALLAFLPPRRIGTASAVAAMAAFVSVALGFGWSRLFGYTSRIQVSPIGASATALIYGWVILAARFGWGIHDNVLSDARR